MTYRDHDLAVDPAATAEFAVNALTDQLSISNTVTKRGDLVQFLGREPGDLVSYRIPGTLPVRQYPLYNDRAQPIVTDTYKETVVGLTISGQRPYNAVKLTDEQKDFELDGTWGNILNAQSEALGRYLEDGVLRQILNAPYEALVTVDDTPAGITAAAELGQDSIFNDLLRAKSLIKKMRTPDQRFVAICGYDFADTLRRSQKLVKDQGLGSAALTDATVGSYAGMTFVESPFIESDQAYLYAPSGFVVATGVHSIPNSVPFGATASAQGWALRWLMDYDTGYINDRSVMDTLAGYTYVRDRLSLYDQQGNLHVADGEHFLRGIRLALKSGGTTEFVPGDGSGRAPGSDPASTLAKVVRGERIEVVYEDGKPWPLGGNYPTSGFVVPDGVNDFAAPNAPAEPLTGTAPVTP